MVEETVNKDNFTAWKVYKAKNIYQYYFRPDGAQGKLISKITFKKVTKKPAAFNNSGYGFTRPLQPLYYLLREYFTKIDEIVVAPQKSEIKGKVIYFNKNEYELMINSLITTYRENANRLKDRTFREMSNIFPRKFKSKEKPFTYTAGMLSHILSRKGVANQLSDEDIAKVIEIVPGLMERSSKAKAGLLSKIRFADIRNKSTSYELKKIVDEYDKLLKKRSQKESDWQEFFKRNMLFINSAYIKLIDKKNINISVSIPDFLLIDQFQFMDVFEIKKPDFECLKFDKSHKNYYWSTEAAMAIAQVEKYLFELEQNSYAIVADLRKQKIDVNIIRPRGYVLIGKRSALDENAQNSFKILNDSLKNVQVIFFDDLLSTLKSKYTIIKKR